jgi:adenylylsulfate kinase-like enzyme
LPELTLLDGDAIRSAFGADLGYKEADRQVQVKRLQNLAKVLSDQGLVVLVAVLYAHPALLDWNRHNIRDYFEIYLEASLDSLRARDSKGWYVRVAWGEIADVVGVDIPWHAPTAPDLVIHVDTPESPQAMARRVALSVPRLAGLLEQA